METQKVYIIGAGGAGQSIYKLIENMGRAHEIAGFLESDAHYQARQVYGLAVKPLSSFDPSTHKAVIALGDSEARYQMASQMPQETQYARYIHPQHFSLSPTELEIGEGSLTYPFCQYSRHLKIGKHALIISDCILGHDSVIGDFFTSTARLNMGGGCTIGDRVYIGMSVSIRDKITICDRAVIGMGAVVVQDIVEPGVYVGNPARKIKDI